MKEKFFYASKILFISICYILLLPICNSYSVTTSAASDLTIDFGSFAQLSENASLILNYDASNTTSGISNFIGSPQPASVEYKQTNLSTAQTEKVTITPSLITATPVVTDTCTISLDNFTASSTSFTLYREGNWLSGATSVTVNYGATLSIIGSCASGRYNGTLSIPYTSEKCDVLGIFGGCSDNSGNPMTFNWTVQIWDKIGASEIQSLDFGSMMSPQVNAKVIMSTAGVRSKNGEIWLDPSNNGKVGMFNVVSIANKTFYVSLPASAILKGSGGTMTADTFTSTVGTNGLTTDANGNATFSIGATLNVPANISSGTYSGNYDVTVYY